jgi:hypothetical protein
VLTGLVADPSDIDGKRVSHETPPSAEPDHQV